MKPTLRPYSLLILLLVLLASCSKKTSVPVPADAAFVFHINGASLNSKLSWDEVKQGELFKSAYAEVDDSFAKKILDNPDSSGIDIKSDAFFFLRVHGRGGYAGFTCVIKDESAFTRLMQEAGEGKPITKQGGLSVLKSHDAVATWNSKRFVFIGDAPDINTGDRGMGSMSYGDRRFSEDSLFRFASEVYELKSSNSIAGNTKFASMMSEEGDAHFWLNPGKFYGGSLASVVTMLPKAATLFEGNFTAATLKFDNGKISIDSKSYYSKEIAELVKKYSMKNLDESVLKKIPSANINAVFAMNYPPEGLKAFLSMLGVDGLANAYLAQMGYSIEDFIKANKGDIILAVTDFNYAEKETKYEMDGKQQSYKSAKPDAKILFATSINEKTSFDKLMNLLQQKVIAEGGPMVESIANKIPYQIKDNWFIAGSDSTQVHSFGNSSTDHSFISKISGHPLGGFIDIQKFIAGSRTFTSNEAVVKAMDLSATFWQDIVFYGGETKDDAIASHMEVNLADKTTNSLKQLNTYLGTTAKIFKEEKDKRKAEWDNNVKMPADTMSVK